MKCNGLRVVASRLVDVMLVYASDGCRSNRLVGVTFSWATSACAGALAADEAAGCHTAKTREDVGVGTPSSYL